MTDEREFRIRIKEEVEKLNHWILNNRSSDAVIEWQQSISDNVVLNIDWYSPYCDGGWNVDINIWGLGEKEGWRPTSVTEFSEAINEALGLN